VTRFGDFKSFAGPLAESTSESESNDAIVAIYALGFAIHQQGELYSSAVLNDENLHCFLVSSSTEVSHRLSANMSIERAVGKESKSASPVTYRALSCRGPCARIGNCPLDRNTCLTKRGSLRRQPLLGIAQQDVVVPSGAVGKLAGAHPPEKGNDDSYRLLGECLSSPKPGDTRDPHSERRLCIA
jgi:hypothetical protein